MRRKHAQHTGREAEEKPRSSFGLWPDMPLFFPVITKKPSRQPETRVCSFGTKQPWGATRVDLSAGRCIPSAQAIFLQQRRTTEQSISRLVSASYGLSTQRREERTSTTKVGANVQQRSTHCVQGVEALIRREELQHCSQLLYPREGQQGPKPTLCSRQPLA